MIIDYNSKEVHRINGTNISPFTFQGISPVKYNEEKIKSLVAT